MLSRLLEENLEGEFTATYAGLRRTAERELAVLELDCDLWTEGEESATDAEGNPRQMTMTLAFDLHGQLLWIWARATSTRSRCAASWACWS
jgi:hypothetical protein